MDHPLGSPRRRRATTAGALALVLAAAATGRGQEELLVAPPPAATPALAAPAPAALTTESQRQLARDELEAAAELRRIESQLESRRRALDEELAAAHQTRDSRLEELEEDKRKQLDALAKKRARQTQHQGGQLDAAAAAELASGQEMIDTEHAAAIDEILAAHAEAELEAFRKRNPEIRDLEGTVAALRVRQEELRADIQAAGLAETRAAEALGLRESFFRELFPERYKGEGSSFLGIEAWQWAVLLALVLLALVVQRVVVFLLYRILRHQLERVPDDLLAGIEQPLSVIAGAALLFAVIGGLGLPVGIRTTLIVATRVVLALGVVWVLWRGVDIAAAFMRSRVRRSQTRLDDLLLPVASRLVKILLAVIGVVFVAQASGVRPTSLLAGLGLGGLAFALASKDTVENFFGFTTLLFDNPFQIGDWIKVGDVEGTVEEVGLRSTRIRTFYDSIITLPNRQLVNATIDNIGARSHRRFSTRLDIAVDTPPERIEAFTEGVREIIRLHPYTRKDYYHVYLNELGEHSLRILVYVFHDVPDWSTELRERHRFLVDVLKLAGRLGVVMPYPTQTLHVPGLASLRPGPAAAAHEDARGAVEVAADTAPASRPAPSIRVPRDPATARRVGESVALTVVREGLPELRIPPPVEIAMRSRLRAEIFINRSLRKVELFAPLEDADLDQLSGRCQELVLPRGAMVVEEGEPGDSLYVITSGALDVSRRHGRRQRRRQIARLESGQCFGEMSLLTGEPRTASVHAREEAELVRVPHEALELVLQGKPELGDRLAALMAEHEAASSADSNRGRRDLVRKVRAFFRLDATAAKPPDA